MTLRPALLTLILAAVAALSMKLPAQTERSPGQGTPGTGVESTDPRTGVRSPADPLSPAEALKKAEEEERKRAEAEEKARKEAEEAVKQAGKSCAVCGTGMIVTLVVVLALNIALMIWVARDAKSRGMDSSVLWMFLVMATGLIGLIIYLCSRPQGALAVCPACGGKRLAVSAICPHCRNA